MSTPHSHAPDPRDGAAPTASGSRKPSRCVAKAGSHPHPALALRRACILAAILLPAVCLADVDPSNTPPGFEPWIRNFFWLIGSVTLLTVLWKQLFPKRMPPIESEFVSKDELQQMCALRHTELEKLIARFEDRLSESEIKRQQSDLKHEERAGEIHRRVNRLVPVIFAIAGKLGVVVPNGDEAP